MASDRMNIRQMMQICFNATGLPRQRIQVVAHEVFADYEYIDFFNLMEEKPRHKHRVRKLNGTWRLIF